MATKRTPSLNIGRVSGYEGVVVAVIATAVRDATEGKGKYKADARAFFAGPMYRHYLQLLGVPSHWLPEAVEEAAKEHEQQILVDVGRGAGA